MNNRFHAFRCLAVLILSLAGAALASAQAAPIGDLGQAPNQKLAILDKVGIDQHLNRQIPLDLTFVDENGKPVQLRQYFGEKPVIVTMVYYQCPMLCSQVLDGLSGSLNGIVRFNLGRDFNVVTISFNPEETATDAAATRKKFMQRYHRAGSEDAWHFLTGKQEQIQAIADALGFRYAWDPEIKQYAHASGIMLLTPDGHISQYYYGIEYAPRDLQLGLVEASHGKIGNVVDQMMLYCYHYDPRQGRYGAAIFNILRASALATVLMLGGFMFIMIRRDKTLAARNRVNKAS